MLSSGHNKAFIVRNSLQLWINARALHTQSTSHQAALTGLWLHTHKHSHTFMKLSKYKAKIFL